MPANMKPYKFHAAENVIAANIAGMQAMLPIKAPIDKAIIDTMTTMQKTSSNMSPFFLTRSIFETPLVRSASTDLPLSCVDWTSR